MMSPQTEGELNKSTGVGGETGDLEIDSWSVRDFVAGVVTVGTSGVFAKLGSNWETTTLESCLNEGLKGSSLKEGRPNGTIPIEGSEEIGLSEAVALSGEVALSERGTLSEETSGVKMDG